MLAPSGATAVAAGPARAFPSAHCPELPVSLTQPAVPAGCAISPVVSSRSRIVTAALSAEVA